MHKKNAFMANQHIPKRKTPSSSDSCDEKWILKLEACQDHGVYYKASLIKKQKTIKNIPEMSSKIRCTEKASHCSGEENCDRNLKDITNNVTCKSHACHETVTSQADEILCSERTTSRKEERSKMNEERCNMDKECSSEYNLRSKKRIVYTELNDLRDDDFLFCEDCQNFFLDECKKHGAPVFVPDSIVNMGTEHRAELTLPPSLCIRISGIPCAGSGVWNEGGIIPKGIHFGPFEGIPTDEETASTSGYAWRILDSQINRIYKEASTNHSSKGAKMLGASSTGSL
ncbi:probable histone-lysine N-methyltransferase PRDM7 [Rana temporaria]|uniref:probable histone-lysine N-methyltransferase PRDM7 n=1 Tax=Rana temporaria TaxID=8407 RepID=UPI001AAD6D29|nr:probable histone-lysine N-methyltransferase PRDM7 [Rana temporaria]